MDEDHFVTKSTETGRLMARYCIAYDTMKQFTNLTGKEAINELLVLLSSCKEFRDVQLRVNERRVLNTLNKDKNRITIRFPMDGKIKTNEMKVNCLIQAQFGCLSIQDFALTQDINKIFRAAQRVIKCLQEYLWQGTKFKALLNAAILSKCFRARLWENSRYVSRQLEGIGITLSTALVNANVTTFQKLEDTNPREIELIVNRHPPFGNNVKDAVQKLPKYELSIDQGTHYTDVSSEITVTIVLANRHILGESIPTAGPGHSCMLLIGDADNKLVYKSRITDAILLKEESWSKRIQVKRAIKGEDLSINLISMEWVGLDVQSSYTPFYTGPKRVARANNYEQDESVKKPSPGGSSSSDYDVQADPNYEGQYATYNQPSSNRRPCSHKCINKDACAHECCKLGIAIKRPQVQKAPNMERNKQKMNVNEKTGRMDHYMNGLKNQVEKIPQTPNIKRMKPSSSKENLNRFSYTPKDRLALTRTPMTKPEIQVTSTGKKRVAVAPNPRGWDELDMYHYSRTDSSDPDIDDVTPEDTRMNPKTPERTYGSNISHSNNTKRDDQQNPYEMESTYNTNQQPYNRDKPHSNNMERSQLKPYEIEAIHGTSHQPYNSNTDANNPCDTKSNYAMQLQPKYGNNTEFCSNNQSFESRNGLEKGRLNHGGNSSQNGGDPCDIESSYGKYGNHMDFCSNNQSFESKSGFEKGQFHNDMNNPQNGSDSNEGRWGRYVDSENGRVDGGFEERQARWKERKAMMDERFNTIWNTGSNNMQPNADSLYGIFDLCDQEDTDEQFVAAKKTHEENVAEDDLPDIEVPNERQHKFSGGLMWNNCNPSTTTANKNIESLGAAICNRTNRRIFGDVSPKIVVSPSMSSDDDDLLVNHLQLAETSINSAHNQNATTWDKSTESECAISPMTTDHVMSQESPIIGHMISERAVEPSSFVTHSLKPADDYDKPTAEISNQSASKCPDRFEASMVRNDPKVVHTSLLFPRRDQNVAPTSMFAASLGNEKDLNEAEETFDNIFSGIF